MGISLLRASWRPLPYGRGSVKARGTIRDCLLSYPGTRNTEPGPRGGCVFPVPQFPCSGFLSGRWSRRCMGISLLRASWRPLHYGRGSVRARGTIRDCLLSYPGTRNTEPGPRGGCVCPVPQFPCSGFLSGRCSRRPLPYGRGSVRARGTIRDCLLSYPGTGEHGTRPARRLCLPGSPVPLFRVPFRAMVAALYGDFFVASVLATTPLRSWLCKSPRHNSRFPIACCLLPSSLSPPNCQLTIDN